MKYFVVCVLFFLAWEKFSLQNNCNLKMHENRPRILNKIDKKFLDRNEFRSS